MTRKMFRCAMVGMIGCALIAPLGGCDSAGTQEKATVDITTPLKSPSAPTTHRVETKPGAKGARK